MREIKFRVFNKNAKCYIMHLGEKEASIAVFDLVSFSEYLTRNNIKKIDFFEIQLCTSLKDKNGKEIYEGDFINWTWEDKKQEPAYVTYYDLGASFILFTKKLIYLHECTNIEVIGDLDEST